MNIWYLAHPVTTDNVRTQEENLESAIDIQQILFDNNIATIMPWYTYVLSYGHADGELRKKMLEFDKAVIKLCQGFILAGHKISAGMDEELAVAVSRKLDIVNLVGFKSERINSLIGSIALHFNG